MATRSSVLAGKFHGQRSLAGCSPWRPRESDRTGRLSAAHSVYLIFHLASASKAERGQEKTYLFLHRFIHPLFILCVLVNF